MNSIVVSLGLSRLMSLVNEKKIHYKLFDREFL